MGKAKTFALGLFAATAMAAASTPASALEIVLHDIGGVSGTKAANGFARAANYWESVITNDVTLHFNVGFSDLGPNVLGGTRSSLTIKAIQNVSGRIAAFGSDSAVDQQVASGGLPALTPGTIGGLGAVEVVTPGYVDGDVGIDNSSAVLDNDGSFNNSAVAVSVANARAIGYTFADGTVDAQIEFSSTFAFDFNAADGISTGTYDFVGVAIHEMGHALGFISGADDYDFVGCPNGPLCEDFADYPVNDDWWGYTMDLFRYSTAYDGNARLDWRPGVSSYFSIDGGATALNGNGNFSSGSFNGDGWQASHWLANNTCTGFVGIMNPYICNGRNSAVSGTDLSAFDAIGWNLVEGARDGNYVFNTRDIGTGAVPEPASWALMILGFGAMGAMVRRRRAALA